MGLGSPYRGDDAAGPLVVAEVARRLAAQPERAAQMYIVEQGDPSELLHLFDGIDLAVLVDAVQTGRPAGSVVILEGGAEAPDPPAIVSRDTGFGGTHALGLASVIELARFLERLPRRLVVVGVEALAFEVGTGLSPSVRAGIDGCVDAVLRLITSGSVRSTEAGGP